MLRQFIQSQGHDTSALTSRDMLIAKIRQLRPEGTPGSAAGSTAGSAAGPSPSPSPFSAFLQPAATPARAPAGANFIPASSFGNGRAGYEFKSGAWHDGAQTARGGRGRRVVVMGRL